ncbi:MAG: hypothetical protein ACYS67_04835 [Planctomycetota bacterium]|jgi:hypothetical protein
MKEVFRVSGFPISQIIISGFIAGVSAIPIVVLWALGKPIHIVIILATTGMFVICIAAILAQPVVTISVDSRKETLTVQWKSFLGIISRSRKLRVGDIRKLVYGVTTYGRTRLSHSSDRTQPTGSRSSFYADMANGTHEYLSPKSKATSGLSKKLGTALSKHLKIPFVRRSLGSGHFKEEPIQSPRSKFKNISYRN